MRLKNPKTNPQDKHISTSNLHMQFPLHSGLGGSCCADLTVVQTFISPLLNSYLIVL